MSAERLAEVQRAHVEMPAVDFSASDIRRRLVAGRSIRYRTPRAVEKYIERSGSTSGRVKSAECGADAA